PPTEVTQNDMAGLLGELYPSSPVKTAIGMPGWWDTDSFQGISFSGAAHRRRITSAIFAAVFTPVPRRSFAAPTSRMWHSAQAAESMSRSIEISTAQSGSVLGNGVALPSLLTFLKQPLAVVHGGRPNCFRYTARSDSAFGSSHESTIATVTPRPR